jgi:ABC-type glycerol-3-phosphate transport system substrate-binding protein
VGVFFENTHCMSNFKLIVSIIFGAFIIIGVMFFITSSGGSGDMRGTVVVWGTYPETVMHGPLREIENSSLTITYEKKDPAHYSEELINAFAAGKGPDVFFLPHTMIVGFADKVVPLPEEVISSRTFRDLFIQEGELFRYSNQTLALPFVVDPLLLYWNRDTFASVGIANPPETWTDVLADSITLTVYDDRRDIVSPGIPLGEVGNIDHAKDIVSMLLLQTGSSIVTEYQGGLKTSFGDLGESLSSVLRFYT